MTSLKGKKIFNFYKYLVNISFWINHSILKNIASTRCQTLTSTDNIYSTSQKVSSYSHLQIWSQISTFSSWNDFELKCDFSYCWYDQQFTSVHCPCTIVNLSRGNIFRTLPHVEPGPRIAAGPGGQWSNGWRVASWTLFIFRISRKMPSWKRKEIERKIYIWIR